MKYLESLVPRGHSFRLSDELFMISKSELDVLISLGPAVSKFMTASQAIIQMALLDLDLSARWKRVRELLFTDINAQYKKTLHLHPQRNSRVTRVDFMVDQKGEFKIAEIDPLNKHGLGFALACRNESGNGDRQKILSYFGELMHNYDEMCIILSPKDKFFTLEQTYFAAKLSESTGKPVSVISGEDLEELKRKALSERCCFLDCPVLDNETANEALIKVFVSSPKRFIIPPKHWMGNKSLMAFVHDNESGVSGLLELLLDTAALKKMKFHTPPTFVGEPWDDDALVMKKVMSSGAKGVFFEGRVSDRDVIYQRFVPQRTYLLDGKNQFIRLAAHYVGSRLAELTVTASEKIPVHGNSSSINYHVGLKTD
ncbi:MAG: hypothetical protein WAV15_03900 [Minisyncoccia bacterium]